MDQQTRRDEATKSLQVRIAEATIKYAKDPKRVAAARLYLEALRGERTWDSFLRESER